MDEKLMIEPPPSCFIWLRTACAAKNCGLRLSRLRPVPVFLGDVVDGVAIVVGGVVDEDADGAELGSRTAAMVALQRCRCR